MSQLNSDNPLQDLNFEDKQFYFFAFQLGSSKAEI